MSEQKTIKGKLTSVDLKGLNIEEYAKKALGENSDLSYHESYIEKLVEQSDGGLIYQEQSNKLYKVTYEEADPVDPNYFFFHHANKDGSIGFVTSFYNGGTYLEEVITKNLPL